MMANFEENQWTAPEAVMLEDGTWRDAPWLSWDNRTHSWGCFLCNSWTGTRVTVGHLEAPRHRTRSTPGPGNQWGWYEQDLGQPIQQVVVHNRYRNPARPLQLALPAPPAGGPPGLVAAPPAAQAQAAPAAPADPPAAPAAPAPPANPPPGLTDRLDVLADRGRETNDFLEMMAGNVHDTAERVSETNEYLATIAERLQLVADRISETNQLLQAQQLNRAPRGTAVQAVRSRQDPGGSGSLSPPAPQ